MIHSRTVVKFLRAHGILSFSSSRKEVTLYKTFPLTFPVEELKWMFKGYDFPVRLGFHFVRGTKHKFDFNNVTQIILDLLVAFDIIEDDNMDYIVPECLWIDGKAYSYDKEKPGVYLRILNKS